jgi:hypothetical protein
MIKLCIFSYDNFSWFYSSDASGGGYSGYVGNYPSSGFSITLASRKADSLAIIEDLKINKWIDELTRAVLIDFTVYNGNINLFNQIRFSIIKTRKVKKYFIYIHIYC